MTDRRRRRGRKRRQGRRRRRRQQQRSELTRLMGGNHWYVKWRLERMSTRRALRQLTPA